MKWLEKYNDGGPIQPNYNESSASFPKGYNGWGYNSHGNNFNAAWGGPYQKGGEIPTANTFQNMIGNLGKYFFDITDRNLIKSKYSPTKGGLEGEEYFTRPGMKEDVYNDLTSEWVKKDYNHTEDFNDIYNAYINKGTDRENRAKDAFPKNQAGYNGMYNRGHGSLLGEFNLGRYRIDAGADKKGKYISFSDTYDWNGLPNKDRLHPIHFYDRIYEEDWNKIRPLRVNKHQEGGIIPIDNLGYYNPDNVGDAVQVEGNDITMRGVERPLVGISDEGDVQLMQPENDYKFEGNSVVELPVETKLPSRKERLLRQVFKESSFRTGRNESSAGAIGPLQIRKIAYNDYVKATGDKDPHDSVTDAEKAVKVRNWLMDNISNADFIKGKPHSEAVKLAKIYAAYNEGKSNLLNQLEQAKAQGIDIYNSLEWVDKLPKETKNYVTDILFPHKASEEFTKGYKKAIKTNSAKPFKKFQEGGDINNPYNFPIFTGNNSPSRGWLSKYTS